MILLLTGALVAARSPRSAGNPPAPDASADDAPTVDAPAIDAPLPVDLGVDMPVVDLPAVDAGPNCRTDRDCAVGLVCDRARSACATCAAPADCCSRSCNTTMGTCN